MRFVTEQHFDAPVDQVLALFTDPDFYPTLTGLPQISTPEVVSHDAEGDTVRIALRQGYVGDLPPGALAVIDRDRLTWVEQLVFHLADETATSHLLPDHYPDRLTCSGRYRFSSTGPSSATRRLDGDLKVRVPLVGGRVERALTDGLVEHARAEQRLIAARLQTT